MTSLSWEVVVACFITAAITASVGTMIRRAISGPMEKREIGPQPLSVKAAPEYMTMEGCARQHGEFDRRLKYMEERVMAFDAKIENMVRNMEQKEDSRTLRIHDRIDGISEQITQTKAGIAGVEATVETHTQLLAQIDQKLTQILRGGGRN